MTFSYGLRAFSLAAIAGLVTSMSLASPVAASGTQAKIGPKVCFKNESGQKLYFKAVYSGKSTGGTKMSNNGKFCTTNPAPSSVRISLERKSAVLCSAPVEAGYTYRLTAPPKGGKCQWNRIAN